MVVDSFKIELLKVEELKELKRSASTETVVKYIRSAIGESFMKDTSIFIEDGVFTNAGCTDRSLVYKELKEKGYNFTEVAAARGEQGGIVISGW